MSRLRDEDAGGGGSKRCGVGEVTLNSLFFTVKSGLYVVNVVARLGKNGDWKWHSPQKITLHMTIWFSLDMNYIYSGQADVKWTEVICNINTISEFWAYFNCACAETAISKLPVKNLTLPFVPATSISCNREITLRSVYMFPVIWRFL